jgi:hypothetical protein
MDERDWLAERFQAHRPWLRAVAYRMAASRKLGNPEQRAERRRMRWGSCSVPDWRNRRAQPRGRPDLGPTKRGSGTRPSSPRANPRTG